MFKKKIIFKEEIRKNEAIGHKNRAYLEAVIST